MPWLRVTLNISGDEIENCENLLLEQGAISVSLENNDSEAVLEPELGKTPFWKSVKLTALFAGSVNRGNIKAMLTDCFHSNTFTFKLIDDKNWLDEHKKNSQAITFNNRLCICPSWIPPPKDVPAILKIDPGLAFGTGEHSTTSLCLERLSEIPLGSKYIVDFGCGSGILALAALKLDAKKALGVDTDPQALAASKKNAQINNLDQALELALPEDSKTTDWLGKADIVIANILANPIKKLATTLLNMLNPDGTLILSGILEAQASEIISHYHRFLSLEQKKIKNGWVLLQGKVDN